MSEHSRVPANLRLGDGLPEDLPQFSVEDDQALSALFAAEEAHFWHRSRNDLIVERLRQHGIGAGDAMLELGCGAGCVTRALCRAHLRMTAVEGHRKLAVKAARRAPEATVWVHDLSKTPLPDSEGRFDAVGLFDVIEHLPEPRAALEGAAHYLKPGGLLVGTVPALMSLWSQVDVQAGHFLRYEAAELRQLCATLAGFELVEVVPFNSHLVPMMWLQRKLVVRESVGQTSEENYRVPPHLVNESLYQLGRVESALQTAMGRWPLPGASLLFVAKRSA